MWWRRIFGVLALITLFAVGVAWWHVSHVPTIGTLIDERSRADLTASAICPKSPDCDLNRLRTQAPIGAPGENRRCGGEVLSARFLNAEPVGCSQIPLTDRFLRGALPDESAYRQFRRTCRNHDFCYRHGQNTFGLTRQQCDQAFLADSRKECRLIYGNSGGDRFRCETRATLAFLAIRSLGRKNYYNSSYGPVCDYERGPHAARDQVVSGRFLGGGQDYALTLTLSPDGKSVALRLMTFDAEDGQSRLVVEKNPLTPQDVNVADGAWACAKNTTQCPKTLADVDFRSQEWLRFSPLVLDADGDGIDDIILPSLRPDYGLMFTHIRVKPGEMPTFEPVATYLGVARMESPDFPNAKCSDQLEFAACAPGRSSGPGTLPSLSSEIANPQASFSFVVVARTDVGCVPEGAPRHHDIIS